MNCTGFGFHRSPASLDRSTLLEPCDSTAPCQTIPSRQRSPFGTLGSPHSHDTNRQHTFHVPSRPVTAHETDEIPTVKGNAVQLRSFLR